MLYTCHSNLSLDFLVMWPAFYKSKRYELNTPILIDFAKTPLPLVIHVSKTNVETTQYPIINDYYDSLMAKDF